MHKYRLNHNGIVRLDQTEQSRPENSIKLFTICNLGSIFTRNPAESRDLLIARASALRQWVSQPRRPTRGVVGIQAARYPPTPMS